MRNIIIGGIVAAIIAVAYGYSYWMSIQPNLINSEIEEPSGIVYHPERNTLYVVDDEGEIFELDLFGNILNQYYLGDFDLEGVTLIDGQVVVVHELGRVFMLDPELENLIELNIMIKEDGEFYALSDINVFIEGIHYTNGVLYLVNQSDFVAGEDSGVEFPSRIFRTKRIEQLEFRGNRYWDFDVLDLAGMSSQGDDLYILSSETNQIIVRNQITKSVTYLKNPITGDQEGITFDEDGYMYMAVDGKGVFKIKLINRRLRWVLQQLKSLT